MDPTSEVARTMIWGTTVNTDHTTRQFREFFTTYTPDGMVRALCRWMECDVTTCHLPINVLCVSC